MAAKQKTGGKKKTAKQQASTNGGGDAAAKKAAREALTAEQMQAVVSRVVNGDEKLAAVAKDLKITPGKAAFLIMQHRVAEGEVPEITGKTDEGLLKAINTARLKGDEYSSWGWLAARSGRSEGFIKTGLAKLDLYTPKADNVASRRAASRAETKKTTGGKKTGGKKRVSGNA